ADPTDAAFNKAIREGFDALSVAERATVEAEIARQPAIYRPMLRRLVEDYDGLQRRIREVLPRALFVLVPALALVLAMFYRRRHYPEHLYTALHLQTFVFLALALESTAEYTQSVAVVATALIITVLLIVAHTVAAQRRIYREPWLKTVLKAVA